MIETRTIACVVCGVEHQRVAWHTWHQDQCDDCIAAWAHEKAVADLDRSIAIAGDEAGIKRNASVLREQLRVVTLWTNVKKARGL